MTRLREFRITDGLEVQNEAAIEVDVIFDNGEKRWCYFMTPEALASCGDLLEGRESVRIHLGVKHMIVASRLDPEVVRLALEQLDREGELYDQTLPYST